MIFHCSTLQAVIFLSLSNFNSASLNQCLLVNCLSSFIKACLQISCPLRKKFASHNRGLISRTAAVKLWVETPVEGSKETSQGSSKNSYIMDTYIVIHN